MKEFIVREGQSVDRVLGKFKKATKDILMEYRSRQYFQKPSEKKNIANETKKHLKKRAKRQAIARKLRLNSAKRKGFDISQSSKPSKKRYDKSR